MQAFIQSIALVLTIAVGTTTAQGGWLGTGNEYSCEEALEVMAFLPLSAFHVGLLAPCDTAEICTESYDLIVYECIPNFSEEERHLFEEFMLGILTSSILRGFHIY